MRRALVALAALYRRWKYVEEEVPTSAPAVPAVSGTSPQGELKSLKVAVERETRILEEYRRFRCHNLARQREASILALTARIRALEMNLRRAV